MVAIVTLFVIGAGVLMARQERRRQREARVALSAT
jgi:hypothetical protein